jgi:hypothetical protein
MQSVKSFIKRKRLDWHRDRVLVAGRQERALLGVAADPDAADWEREFAAHSAQRWNKIRSRHLAAIASLNQE